MLNEIWKVYEDSIVHSCSGTYISQLLNGMVLNVVLKYTHEKQAGKCCPEVVVQTMPLWLSVSSNLKVFNILITSMNKVVIEAEQNHL